MRILLHLCICLVGGTVLYGFSCARAYSVRHVPSGLTSLHSRLSGRSQCVFAECMPLTANQVDRLEREYIGFEAEEPQPPKCPLLPHHLSKRIVNAIIDHDMNMLMDRSMDASGRPSHLQQKWKMRYSRKRLSPELFRVGEKLKGRVCITFPTYALVDIGSTSYGVLHARDMSEGWIDRVDHSVSSGDDIVVIVKSIDSDGRFVRLTLLDLPKLESPTGAALVRRPLHSFKVEETVSGVIRRRSPLGYYIDIGATVDGFLHVNDRKLPRKYTGVSRQPFRIGTYVPTLYVKSIDLIKNRIQLSENSLSEELEKRCITGQETPEQQSTYASGARTSMLQRMQATDFEHMRMIGGYDSLLDHVGGHRNSTTEYVMYLYNRKMKAELERQRDSVLDDADNMSASELRRATKEYNRISMQIAELNDEANEPPPFERTVYKYGDPGVWESRVYTPFDERAPHKYFEKLTDEVTSALRDVQGENFNFKGAMSDDLYNAEHRSDFVEMLWSRFHEAPSKLSKIEDTEPREPVLEDVEDLFPASLLSDTGPSHLSRPPDPDTVISTLESYNDPDADDLAQMIRDASGFNPFAHSPKLIDDDKTALAGACAMVNDDVTQWQARFDKMYEDGGIDPMTVAIDTLSGKSTVGMNGGTDVNTNIHANTVSRDDALLDSVPNVDDLVDSTCGADSESSFVAPTVDGSSSDIVVPDDVGPESIDDPCYPGSYSSDCEVSASDYSDSGSEYDDSTDLEGDVDVAEDPDADFKEVAADVFGAEERLNSALPLPDSIGVNGNSLHHDGHLRSSAKSSKATGSRAMPDFSEMVPKGPLEPEETLYMPRTLSEDVRAIFDEVKALTDDSKLLDQPIDSKAPERAFHSRDTQKIKYEMYRRQQRYMDAVTRLYMMTKVLGRALPSDSESTHDVKEIADSLAVQSSCTDPGVNGYSVPSDDGGADEGAYSTGFDTVSDVADSSGSVHASTDFDFWSDADEPQSADVDPLTLKEARSLAKSVCNSDQRRRTLARLARKHLSPEEVAKYKFDQKDPEYMEEMAKILRQGRERPKTLPYTYFPEGIDNAGIGEDRRTMNRRVRDANLKLAKLKRNKRFLHMLGRLGVDADDLTFENVHLLLPRELVSERPPPFRRQMGIGESNLPDNKG